jgi:AraC family transcriptional regulator
MADQAIVPSRFEDGGELLITGLKERYSLETRSNIPNQWERFLPYLGKVAGQVGGESYGVCWNSDAECNFDYLTGVAIGADAGLPQSFTQVQIPPQRYAVFTHRGHISSIGETLHGIWGKWLPTSGFRPAEGPCFERYTEDFDPQAGAGSVEIWIPIEE